MDYPELDYFLNESLSDVIFVVDGHRVPALKSLLSLKSRVFGFMFSEIAESEESKLPEIEIKDTTVEAFKTLIRFIYTEVLIFEDQTDWPHIWVVYQLSDRFEVLRLRQKVFTHLESSINISNLMSISRFVFIHNIKELIPNVLAFIQMNFEELMENHMKNGLKEVNDLSNDRLLDILTKEAIDKANSSNLDLIKVLYGSPLGLRSYLIQVAGNTFSAIKAFIGLLYFDKLCLKDDTDFQLIREVCDICYKDQYLSKNIRPVLIIIGNYLKNKISDENLETISRMAFVYNLDELKESLKF